MKKLFAFTLAETLIVMGVIGVVAALTLPNLTSSTNNKEKVAKVKKLYSNISDAIGRASAVYGPIEDWPSMQVNSCSSDSTNRYGGRIAEFMKISKDCGGATGGKCFGPNGHNIKGTTMYSYGSINNYPCYKRFITADGSSVAINPYNGYLEIIVDVDGPNKGRDRFGEDVFVLSYVKNPSRDDLLADTTCGTISFSDLLSSLNPANGEGWCAGYWVLKYDNMDYLKIGSDGKCLNGTTPTESNPTCN